MVYIIGISLPGACLSMKMTSYLFSKSSEIRQSYIRFIEELSYLKRMQDIP